MSSNSLPSDDGSNLNESNVAQGEKGGHDESTLELEQQQTGSSIGEQQQQTLSQVGPSESLSYLMSSGAFGTPTPGFDLLASSPSATEAASSTIESAIAGATQLPQDASIVTTPAPSFTNPYASLPFLDNMPAVTDSASSDAITQQESLNNYSSAPSSVYPSTNNAFSTQLAQQQLASSLRLQQLPYPGLDAASNNIHMGAPAPQDMNLIAQQNIMLRQILQAQTQIMHQQNLARQQQQALGSIPLVPGQLPTSMGFASGLGLGAAAILPTAMTNAASAQGTLLKRKDPPPSFLTGDVDDKPKRPCSAYNLFFKDERKKILEEIEEKEAEEKSSKEGGPDDEDDRKPPAKQRGKKADPKSKRGLPPSVEGEGESNDMGSNTSEETKRLRRRKPHGKIGFEDLTKQIAKRWKNIDPERHLHYDKLAKQAKVRYKEQLAAYIEKQRSGTEAVLKKLNASVSERTKDLHFPVKEKTSPDKRKGKKPKK